ncbi:avr2 family secreted RxLR effector peptide protein, putative [Phytophthora infestans T30-4]|uniref:RxLR effector protein n=2 Tax=Phytophthora infestans TaxID=4787 RepID=D0N6C5_PHYIT|nr:avr2 family secreted RxLR effector peptide protein, putative [Phytophthora infestans T30-4]EEY70616.1 avr2 family secreted RxLR effector peptide protein, putative [Phytophthora infestans T30-4]KAF4045393.1 RXLR domain-containing protein [Phytophthora infestans]KAF4129724.1 RXLR effector domain-containing protein [Phytophthora infestans]|eukprot:XP_002998270.1 avr2 family secreted RxLR effector peptide protein, putative [Phytophthora infestans T30-4]
MRLTYILATMTAATLHLGTSALPAVTEPKPITENGASFDVVASAPLDGGRFLRRVDNDRDDSEEERTIGNAILEAAKKLDPVEAVKKAKEAAKRKKSILETMKLQAWLEKMRETIMKD